MLIVGCGGSTASSGVSAVTGDSGAVDAGSDGVDASADGAVEIDASVETDANVEIDAGPPNPCADTFGTELTQKFGRIDGTLFAIVKPEDQECTRPNSAHVNLEVMMHGAVYRMLINVESDQTQDARVRFFATDATLPESPWEEGWHTTGTPIDYGQTFGVHSTSFTPYVKADLVKLILSEVKIGDKLAIYATGFGEDGGHNIHRNGANNDGAVIVNPDGKARVLLFHFEGQTF
jgi:hypothetical protein